MDFKTTADIKIGKRIIDHIIGQDEGSSIIKKSSKQKRHVLLIGQPGTGKSMMGQALAELLPVKKLSDIIVLPNPKDENQPIIRSVSMGKGRELIEKAKLRSQAQGKNKNMLFFAFAIIAMIFPWWIRSIYGDIMAAASMLAGMFVVLAFAISMNVGMKKGKSIEPKLLVDSSERKKAPFIEATGAHAGALLGDVRHDPFQSFLGSNKVEIDGKQIQVGTFVNNMLKRYSDNVRVQDDYEAVFLPKAKYSTKKGTNILSVNRYKYEGPLVKITTDSGKKLVVTPEHKIAVLRDGKIKYVEANMIRDTEELVTKAEEIIDVWDIINTYSERQQELAKSYYDYLKLRNQNPSWGYKRIATKLGVSYGRTRWWWDNNSAPVSVQTVEWLKERNLLPLRIDNPNMALIAKILGATFGDGGIFANLNGIFLSSSEKPAVEEFGKDLEKVFGESVVKNSLLREGGEYGHSWNLVNTNRKVIRFFQAIGTPIGTKTIIRFEVPSWVMNNKILSDKFFGAYFGSELGTPSISKSGNHLTSLDVGLTCNKDNKENRINFLNQVREYLTLRKVKTGKIYERQTENDRILLKLLFSNKFDNLANFITNVPIEYCTYKKQRLNDSFNNLKALKAKRFKELSATTNKLTNRPYSKMWIKNNLNLTRKSFKFIFSQKGVSEWK